jgi:hypothetical protein
MAHAVLRLSCQVREAILPRPRDPQDRVNAFQLNADVCVEPGRSEMTRLQTQA